ncbi:uncharacterized protein JCM6883_005599 [Sporobolomyces salmoneus]|uniref:uncharacterized protein n=1 Tax=Sporobolomyces salmoneus TaxID=183962 RepID=UPI0031770D9A
MDSLSRLPIELLDLIFELANPVTFWGSKLTTRPISKSLLVSQERALYRTVIIHSWETITLLISKLSPIRHKGQYVRNLRWSYLGSLRPGTYGCRAILSYLPNLLELDFDGDEATTIEFLRLPELLPALRVYRLPNSPLTLAIVERLKQIPTLRLVEVSSVQVMEEEEEEEEAQTSKTARQVLQVAIRSDSAPTAPATARLLRFFPTASISSLDVQIHHLVSLLPFSTCSIQNFCPCASTWGYLISLKKKSTNSFPDSRIFRTSTSTFASYQLRSRPIFSTSLVLSPSVSPTQVPVMKNNNVRIWINSWKTFTSYRASASLLSTSKHVKAWRISRFGKPRKISTTGRGFGVNLDDEGSVVMSDRELPWALTLSELSDILPQVIAMEKKARANGLIVKSNLWHLIEVFQLAILEFYNRAVGALYYRGFKQSLRHALTLAKKEGIDIDRLEVNLDDDFDWEDLEWFEVKLKVGRTTNCPVYGLRLKIKSDYGNSEVEEESDRSE